MSARRRVGVIPARWGATRLPGKPLLEVRGMPMVVRTWRQVQRARGLDEVVVATDDERIAAVVREHGGTALMTSPRCPSGSDRVLEAAERLGLAPRDIVVNVQGDEPFVDPRHVDQLVQAMPGQDMGTLAVKMDAEDPTLADPNVVKVVMDRQWRALYFSRAAIPYARGPLAHMWRHVGLYAFSMEFLRTFAALPPSDLEQAESLEQLRVLEAGHSILVVPVEGPLSPGIDTPEQLARANEGHKMS